MLALIFRGVFFVGVVGWYSTSLWKMIDGYFKDQFQRYLDEEYQRNPKMREDVRIHAAAVDKLESKLTGEPKEAEIQRLLESCGLNGGDTCQAAGEADSLADSIRRREDESIPALSTTSANAFAAGVTLVEKTRKEVARPLDASAQAFREHDDPEPPDQISNNKNNEEEKARNVEEQKQAENLIILKNKKEEHQQKKEKLQARKKRKSGKRPRIGAKSEEVARRKNKRIGEIPTLTLTDDDIDSAMRKRRFTNNEYERPTDSDFSEFDDEDSRALNENYEDEEENAGILTADLPFKPLIDVYDLERLSGEEFCPLTLEDDPSCEDTRSWP